jgi:hypothetical protein
MKTMFKGALGAFMVALALCGLTATSALAASPSVETKPATSIAERSAKLNGVVNPSGLETKYKFEYGTTIAYGKSTAEASLVAGTTNVEVGKSVLGLEPSTTYHFRIVATNSSGTSDGADKTFTTLAPPPSLPEVVVTSGKVSELEFSAKGGAATVEWGGGITLTCTSSELSGHFVNSKELEGKMRWSECYGGDRYECSNERETKEGYTSSWVQSETLKGKLGYINKTKKEVGLLLAAKSSEVWAKKVDCLGGTESLNGSLGGQLGLPVNTKIPTSKSLGMVYTEKEDKQITGELGGQLLYPSSSNPFGFKGEVLGKANKEFEIQA